MVDVSAMCISNAQVMQRDALVCPSGQRRCFREVTLGQAWRPAGWTHARLGFEEQRHSRQSSATKERRRASICMSAMGDTLHCGASWRHCRAAPPYARARPPVPSFVPPKCLLT